MLTRRILRENWREHEVENSSRKAVGADFMMGELTSGYASATVVG